MSTSASSLALFLPNYQLCIQADFQNIKSTANVATLPRSLKWRNKVGAKRF